jgi:hypothetical protein
MYLEYRQTEFKNIVKLFCLDSPVAHCKNQSAGLPHRYLRSLVLRRGLDHTVEEIVSEIRADEEEDYNADCRVVHCKTRNIHVRERWNEAADWEVKSSEVVKDKD